MPSKVLGMPLVVWLMLFMVVIPVVVIGNLTLRSNAEVLREVRSLKPTASVSATIAPVATPEVTPEESASPSPKAKIKATPVVTPESQ